MNIGHIEHKSCSAAFVVYAYAYVFWIQSFFDTTIYGLLELWIYGFGVTQDQPTSDSSGNGTLANADNLFNTPHNFRKRTIGITFTLHSPYLHMASLRLEGPAANRLRPE